MYPFLTVHKQKIFITFFYPTYTEPEANIQPEVAFPDKGACLSSPLQKNLFGEILLEAKQFVKNLIS